MFLSYFPAVFSISSCVGGCVATVGGLVCCRLGFFQSSLMACPLVVLLLAKEMFLSLSSSAFFFLFLFLSFSLFLYPSASCPLLPFLQEPPPSGQQSHTLATNTTKSGTAKERQRPPVPQPATTHERRSHQRAIRREGAALPAIGFTSPSLAPTSQDGKRRGRSR